MSVVPPIAVLLPNMLVGMAPGRSLSDKELTDFSPPAACARLLARGHCTDSTFCEGDPLEVWMAQRLGWQSLPNGSEEERPWNDALAGHVPWAMVNSQAPANTRWWVSPVHIEVGRDGVRLVPPDELALSEAEAQALWAVAQPLLQAQGWRTANEQWGVPMSMGMIMESNTPLNASIHSPWASGRRKLTDQLPNGPDLQDWRRLWMGLQMELHGHPVNQARAARGLAEVNAFWWWGGGPAWVSEVSEVSLTVRDVFTSGHGQRLLPDSLHRCAAWLAPWLQGASGLATPLAWHLLEGLRPAAWFQQVPGLAAFDADVLAGLQLTAAPHELVLLGQGCWRCARSNAALRWKFWKNTPSAEQVCETVEGLLDEADLAAAWQAAQAQQNSAQAQW